MEQEAVHFGENSIIKSVFHKNKKSINIDEVELKEQHYHIKNHTVKVNLSTLLDTDIKVMLFHLHYV